MDNNEFSLDALLGSDCFIRYESVETRCALNNLFNLIEKNVGDEKAAEMTRGACDDYGSFIYNDAFRQGYCFAVKSLKFMLGI